jgi:phosphopantetheinyl transferase
MDAADNETAVTLVYCSVDDMRAVQDACMTRIAPLYAHKARHLFDVGTAAAEGAALRQVASGALLAFTLGVTSDHQLSYGSHGKPRLSEGGCCFNISHSQTQVVLAYASHEVGVDVETIPEQLSQHQVLALGRALGIAHERGAAPTPELRAHAATPLLWTQEWTRVEAILKALGTGFSLGPQDYLPLMNQWQCQWVQLDRALVCVASAERPVVTIKKFDPQAWLCGIKEGRS